VISLVPSILCAPMNVARHRHAVDLDLDDVLVRSDVLCDLTVNITGDQIGLGV